MKTFQFQKDLRVSVPASAQSAPTGFDFEAAGVDVGVLLPSGFEHVELIFSRHEVAATEHLGLHEKRARAASRVKVGEHEQFFYSNAYQGVQALPRL